MQTDTPRRVDQYGCPLELRIIGLELRLRDNYGGSIEEIALIPCDIRIPAGDGYHPSGRSFNCTVHTSVGDTNFQGDALVPNG